MKRAYRTVWSGVTSIVAAESVAQARYRASVSIASAGWPVKWVAIRVVRAPEYDGWAAVDATGKHIRLLVMPDPNEPYYHDEWQTDGSEGDFGRRRKCQ